jgi:signal transduction histidine kinase
VAVLAVAVALAIRLALDELLGEEFQPYAAIYVAVALVAWWGGVRAAIVTSVLGLFSTLWAIVPPRNSLAVRGLPDVVDILIFLFVAITIIILTYRMQRARTALAKANASLEGLVQERTAKLQQTVEDLEHFSHALVHDMRAPLRAMHSYSSLLEQDLGKTAQPQSLEFTRRIRASAERLDALVNDSLSYTTVLRGEMPLGPIDLAAFLRVLIETYPDLQPHAGEIQLAEGLPRVMANPGGLTQCFANLLRNAVKFVAPGVKPYIQIRAEPRGDFVRIWLRDNGIGIPREAQQRIFGMFERSHPEYEGTGIGLAIVQKAVQRMGGGVGVESEPGKGSSFWLDLQRAF